jgi:uncharacterized protein (TIGR01777 family)
MRAVLAGGSGALGRRIAGDLSSRGHDVVILTRRISQDSPYRQMRWDGERVDSWARELSGALVVNLAGELVDRRPTRSNIELLMRSRVNPTRALVAASRTLEVPPRLWIQASTLAIYGDAGESILDETSRPAEGPPQMAGVARAWEEAAAELAAERRVVMRMGIVLDRGTPALDRLVSITRWGLGGRVGSGRQWISWIHISDLLSVVRRAITDDALDGMVHVTSPNPVRNAEMMASLRRVLRRPPAPPTPAALVHLGARLLRTDPALALTGRRCVPRRLLDMGFVFTYPDLLPALDDLLR